MLSEISGLVHRSAVFLPADPPREGRVAFWHPDGAGLPAAVPPAAAAEELTVVTPDLRLATVPALVLPVGAALPVLTRARAAATAATASSPASPAAFWGAAALLALGLAARGLLLPGLSPAGHDAWRMGPLDADDLARIRELAAAMPPGAHCVPLGPTVPLAPTGPLGPTIPTAPLVPGGTPAPLDAPGALRLPAPEPLLRAFLDAVADTLPRSPAAPAATRGPAYAAAGTSPDPRPYAALRPWADEVAATHDAGIRISLRLELREPLAPHDPDDPHDPDGARETPRPLTPAASAAPAFRAVLRLHGRADASLAADAADVWTASHPAAAAFPPRARLDALRALRRAARIWPALSPLLTAAVPDAVDLADEEVGELLGEASAALAADGVQVDWPRGLARTLTSRAVIGTGAVPPPAGAPALPPTALFDLGWRHSLGEGAGDLTPAELDRLAEAKRPLVRLRDQWVLVDPAAVRAARARRERPAAVTAADALASVLTGSAEIDGEPVEAVPVGALAALRDRLTGELAPVTAPVGLNATLRDYQLRGLAWLDLMTSLGLGGCLADDMGLGKTVTLIALHLHRGRPEPTLVVCPASLLGNWQREIERFAPGVAVRRFHGGDRSLDSLAGGFVLTTYGTMRASAGRLAAQSWGLVVADEAQHVKNPHSATAKALRTIPSPARVALTGTPVENNLSELWALLDWTTPGLLGPLTAFRARHARPVEHQQEEDGGNEAAVARLAALVRPFLLRRRKSDPGIAPELPPKTETDHPVSLTREQVSLYQAAVEEAMAVIEGSEGIERRGMIMKLLASLKQICNHPAQYLREADPRIPHRSGKLALLDELLDTILAEGGSVLVFTQYV
ncbi:SNF2-related protein, partial [Streptomyces sp. NPDC089915]|uniref:DEAD/DEAH box helicase n=1 Tax=Streptomyces sp. NPDC089915 TaxID=3155186 RepID=UPI0034132041